MIVRCINLNYYALQTEHKLSIMGVINLINKK